jgi:hypothetical protein
VIANTAGEDLTLILAAVASCASAVKSWLNGRAAKRIEIQIDGRLDDALARIAQLSRAIGDAGLAVPPMPRPDAGHRHYPPKRLHPPTEPIPGGSDE